MFALPIKRSSFSWNFLLVAGITYKHLPKFKPTFNRNEERKSTEQCLSQRSPLSLVSTTEELLERKSSGSGIETWQYDRRDPSRSPRGILYPQKLALTSPTSGDRLVCIVRTWTQATEFNFQFWCFTSYKDLTLQMWRYMRYSHVPWLTAVQCYLEYL
jgi:hypothetical protein